MKPVMLLLVLILRAIPHTKLPLDRTGVKMYVGVWYLLTSVCLLAVVVKSSWFLLSQLKVKIQQSAPTTFDDATHVICAFRYKLLNRFAIAYMVISIFNQSPARCLAAKENQKIIMMNTGRLGLHTAFSARRAHASGSKGLCNKSRQLSSLVTGDWVVKKSNENVVILDCSNPTGFQRAHIPNAFSLPLAANGLKDISFDPSGMISEKDFTTIMQSLNIDNRHTLVFYDDQMSLVASRAWWVARYFGFPKEQLKVLDGGWNSWIHENRPVTNRQVDPFKVRSQGTFKPQIQNNISINLRSLESHLEDQTAQIVDTRSEAEYLGLNASGNNRVGRVPGAFHFEWRDAINEKENDKFLQKKELEQHFMTRFGFGLNKDKPTITYCQRGIRAAHTAFLLQEILDFKQVQVYEGSMMEYLNREDTKVEI